MGLCFDQYHWEIQQTTHRILCYNLWHLIPVMLTKATLTGSAPKRHGPINLHSRSCAALCDSSPFFLLTSGVVQATSSRVLCRNDLIDSRLHLLIDAFWNRVKRWNCLSVHSQSTLFYTFVLGLVNVMT